MRRQNVCHDCGLKRKWLHRHHLIPKSQGGSNDLGNIIEICANCHEDRHGGPFGGIIGGNRLAHAPAAKAKRRSTMLALWRDPEYRERMVDAHRRAVKHRDWKATAEKIKAHWTPEKRAAHAKRIQKTRAATFWSSRGPNLKKNGRSKRWSGLFKCCIVCGTTKIKHRGRGLCRTCYTRKLYADQRAKARGVREAELRKRESRIKF